MNTTTITILILLAFNIVFSLGTYFKETNSTIEQNNRIESLEANQPDTTKDLEDKNLLIDAILELNDKLNKAIEVYDENVNIYNKKIKEHGDTIDAIVDYLK